MRYLVMMVMLGSLFLSGVIGCGPSADSVGTTADQDELAKYVSEHPNDEGVEPPPN